MDREQDGEVNEVQELDESGGMRQEQDEGDDDEQQEIQAITDLNVDEIDNNEGSLMAPMFGSLRQRPA